MRGCAGPTYLDISGRCSISRKDADVEWRLGTPLPMFAALLHSFDVADLGNNREDDLKGGKMINISHLRTTCSS